MIIKYFSWVKDLAETNEETIELPENVKDVEDLINFLEKKNNKYKEIFSKKHLIKVAVNKKYVNTSFKLNKNDEIAFFPPVTGG